MLSFARFLRRTNMLLLSHRWDVVAFRVALRPLKNERLFHIVEKPTIT
jgi:hypothetical protein